MVNQKYQETHSVEPDNIHEVMYNMSVKSDSTMLDLDPINIGGSESYGDASGCNWNSGG